MTALPLGVTVGSTEDKTNERAVACGVKRVGENRTKLVLQDQDPIFLTLPYELVNRLIDDFYDNSDAPELDLTKEAIAKIRKDNGLGDVVDPKIGEYVSGKGIFAGTWEPKDREGNSLNQTFNLYAARTDIGALKTFNKTVEHVAGIKDLDGHDGFNHNVRGKTEDEALYDALRSGTYAGEWFVPPQDALNDNLYANRDKGELKGTFNMEVNYSGLGLLWYWSCTGYRDGSSCVWGQSFAGGDGSWGHKDGGCSLSGRLLRAELRL